jgi:hypothetical protein
MAYGIDLVSAAGRYFHSAEELYLAQSAGCRRRCKAVAGYLYGIAGELAVKELLRKTVQTKSTKFGQAPNPNYMHFPELKSAMKEQPGRLSERLRKLGENDSWFQNWDIAMRYAATDEIDEKSVERWREHAKGALTIMWEHQ